TGNLRGSRRWRQQGDQHLDCGGLAGAVRTEQPEHLTAFQRNRHCLDGSRLAEPACECLSFQNRHERSSRNRRMLTHLVAQRTVLFSPALIWALICVTNQTEFFVRGFLPSPFGRGT